MSDNSKALPSVPFAEVVELRCIICGEFTGRVYQTVSSLNRHCVATHGKTYHAGGSYRDIPSHMKGEFLEKRRISGSRSRKTQGAATGLYSPVWEKSSPLVPGSLHLGLSSNTVSPEHAHDSFPLGPSLKATKPLLPVRSNVGKVLEDAPSATCARIRARNSSSTTFEKLLLPVVPLYLGENPAISGVDSVTVASVDPYSSDLESLGSLPSLSGLAEFGDPPDVDSLIAIIFPPLLDETVTNAVMSPDFVSVDKTVESLVANYQYEHGRGVLMERVRQARTVFVAANQSIAKVFADEVANSSSLAQIFANVQRHMDSLPIYE